MLRKFLATLAILTIFAAPASAAIVVTTVQVGAVDYTTIVGKGIVTVDVLAHSDAADAVAAFGITLDASAANLDSFLITAAPPAAPWSQLAAFAGTPTSSSTARFLAGPGLSGPGAGFVPSKIAAPTTAAKIATITYTFTRNAVGDASVSFQSGLVLAPLPIGAPLTGSGLGFIDDNRVELAGGGIGGTYATLATTLPSALNVTINGITAIPEPSSLALLGLVGIGLPVVRRRRR
jgi:hypothetical protein